jgi:predicted TPR repeat methyltransferase
MAKALGNTARRIEGCDLAPAMIREAQRSGCYAELSTLEAGEWLGRMPDASADLILAADVFCYIETLDPILLAARRVIRDGGMMAFSIQSHPGSGVIVGEDLRVHHAVSHVENLAMRTGWDPGFRREITLRLDRQMPVQGAIFVLRPAD